jgi:hypothetical protein
MTYKMTCEDLVENIQISPNCNLLTRETRERCSAWNSKARGVRISRRRSDERAACDPSSVAQLWIMAICRKEDLVHLYRRWKFSAQDSSET